MGKRDRSEYFLGTINKALAVLDLFKKHTTLGITEIAQFLFMDTSNVFRIVITLEYWGYLEKTEGKKYRLGTTLAYLGNLVLERQEIIATARPFLIKLKDTFNETTHLAIFTSDNEMTFLVKEVSSHSIQMDSTIGLKMPLYCTANGKVLLAFSNQALINDYIKNIALVKKTERTIFSKDVLLQTLRQIQENGFGVDDEESEVGLICYAAPLRNMGGKVIASISMSGPAFRMVDNKEAKINAVKTTASEISRVLGYAK